MRPGALPCLPASAQRQQLGDRTEVQRVSKVLLFLLVTLSPLFLT